MKKIFFRKIMPFATFLSATFVIASAQNRLAGPTHPLASDYNAPVRYRTAADRVVYREYDAGGNLRDEGSSVYRRSANGLTDTVTTHWGLSSDRIYEYDGAGNVISISDVDMEWPANAPTETVRQEYRYDAAGRLVESTMYEALRPEMSPVVTNTYLYTEDSTVHSSISSGGIPQRKVTRFESTDSGYVATSILTTESGSVRRDTSVYEYVFDASGRLLRGGPATFSYPGSGGYVENITGIDGTFGTIKRYDEKGGLTKEESYLFSEKSGIWELTGVTEVSYQYSHPQHACEVAETDHDVYGTEGAVAVQSAAPSTVVIHSITGQLIGRTAVDAGTTIIPVSAKGLHIVAVGRHAYRVFVR
jgi:hypothetical protein